MKYLCYEDAMPSVRSPIFAIDAAESAVCVNRWCTVRVPGNAGVQVRNKNL